MLDYITFRYRRQIRRFRRDLRLYQKLVIGYIDRHIWGRWHQLRLVRRFIIIWMTLALVMAGGTQLQTASLARAALVPVPIAGGTFTEGAVGTVKILNPLLPESETTADINKLIFNGLTQVGPKRQILPDLATSWDISADGRTYTFHLRHGVTWQDGVPFTSADVVFTLAAIQNPDSRSPLASSWLGVTVAAKDDFTVVYTLPNAFTPFIQSTTVGIVPAHLLENIDPSTLRENSFNQNPVGTGPFQIQTFEPDAGEITLVPNPHYYGGHAQLDGFTFRFYTSDKQLLAAYAKHQIISIGRLETDEVADASKQPGLVFDDFSTPSETTLFFKTTDKTLASHDLRLALAKSLDRQSLIAAAMPNDATPATQPILADQLGFTDSYQADQPDPAAAAQLLDGVGITRDAKGLRELNGKPLTLSLVTLQGGELEAMANAMKTAWAKQGVTVNVTAVPLDDLEQSYIRPRNYQMLLFGINIGGDPDVYAYWHSSQVNDPGLNLSQYSSPTADAALEAGRIKTDPEVRTGKYEAFLKAWDADEPAMVIDSPIYRYGVSDTVGGITHSLIIDPEDRFFEVQRWTVRQEMVKQ